MVLVISGILRVAVNSEVATINGYWITLLFECSEISAITPIFMKRWRVRKVSVKWKEIGTAINFRLWGWKCKDWACLLNNYIKKKYIWNIILYVFVQILHLKSKYLPVSKWWLLGHGMGTKTRYQNGPGAMAVMSRLGSKFQCDAKCSLLYFKASLHEHVKADSTHTQNLTRAMCVSWVRKVTQVQITQSRWFELDPRCDVDASLANHTIQINLKRAPHTFRHSHFEVVCTKMSK